MIHGRRLFSVHSSHSRHLYIWLWNSTAIDGALLVLRRVCQKCSEPEVWITEFELSGLRFQLCRVYRPLSPTTFVSSFASIVDRMHMHAISSISPSICFIRLSSKEPEVFCSRAKTSIGLIFIDVGEFDQFCALSLSFSPYALPLSSSRIYIRDIRYTDNLAPSNTRSVSQITIAHTIDRCRIGVSLIREYADQRDINSTAFFLQKSIFVKLGILRTGKLKSFPLYIIKCNCINSQIIATRAIKYISCKFLILIVDIEFCKRKTSIATARCLWRKIEVSTMGTYVCHRYLIFQAGCCERNYGFTRLTGTPFRHANRKKERRDHPSQISINPLLCFNQLYTLVKFEDSPSQEEVLSFSS